MVYRDNRPGVGRAIGEVQMSQAAAIRRRRETRLDKRYQPASGQRYSKQAAKSRVAGLHAKGGKK